MSAAPHGKVAVVTGAGSGIGRAVAQALHDAGYRVVLAGRRREALEETADGQDGYVVQPTDVADAASVSALFDRAVAEYGRVDVLFNNAGITGPAGGIDEISLADWNETVAVNLTGSMMCAAAAVRVMKAQEPQGGRIINNGSIAAHAPRPLSVAYTATKHAITGLTKSIELDGRAWGITCGQIDIGNTLTAIAEKMATGPGPLQPDGSRRREPTFPVTEAARAVVFMADQPVGTTVPSVMIMASGMPFVGRG